MARWLMISFALALAGCSTCTDSPYSAAMLMVPQPGQCAYCDYPGVHEEAACPMKGPVAALSR